MGKYVTFDEMNELLDEVIHSGGETWVEIDGQTYYTDWGYGNEAIEFFIRMLKNRKSDNDATLVRHSVAEDVDEIIEHVLNANMLSMPYDVYSELFDAVDGLGVEIENLQQRITTQKQTIQAYRDESREWREVAEHAQAENDKLRELVTWLLGPYRLGAVTGEGVSREWCRETYDDGLSKAMDLGVEV